MSIADKLNDSARATRIKMTRELSFNDIVNVLKTKVPEGHAMRVIIAQKKQRKVIKAHKPKKLNLLKKKAKPVKKVPRRPLPKRVKKIRIVMLDPMAIV